MIPKTLGEQRRSIELSSVGWALPDISGFFFSDIVSCSVILLLPRVSVVKRISGNEAFFLPPFSLLGHSRSLCLFRPSQLHVALPGLFIRTGPFLSLEDWDDVWPFCFPLSKKKINQFLAFRQSQF